MLKKALDVKRYEHTFCFLCYYNSIVKAEEKGVEMGDCGFELIEGCKDVRSRAAVLFQSERDEEDLRVECAITADGCMDIMQESAGPLTEWCFEESPHRVETYAGADAVDALMRYFHLDIPEQLPELLRIEYMGYDCGMRIRALMRSLDVPYEVIESDIVR